MIHRTAAYCGFAVVACAALMLAATAIYGQAESQEQPAATTPEQRTANYRPLPGAGTPPEIPPVVMSKEHEALCRVKVGDAMPAIKLNELGGREMELSRLFGKTATIVVFWKGDGHMARTMLADLGPDVIQPFTEQGIAVVGIAVEQSARDVLAALEKAELRIPCLLDPEGKAFALVGKERLPRVYLLDPQGELLWLDIEYSLATRRELNQSLRAVVATAARERQE